MKATSHLVSAAAVPPVSPFLPPVDINDNIDHPSSTVPHTTPSTDTHPSTHLFDTSTDSFDATLTSTAAQPDTAVGVDTPDVDAKATVHPVTAAATSPVIPRQPAFSGSGEGQRRQRFSTTDDIQRHARQHCVVHPNPPLHCLPASILRSLAHPQR